MWEGKNNILKHSFVVSNPTKNGQFCRKTQRGPQDSLGDYNAKTTHFLKPYFDHIPGP